MQLDLDVEEMFAKIIKEAINNANRIMCMPEEYIYNLEAWKEDIDEAIRAMKGLNKINK